MKTRTRTKMLLLLGVLLFGFTVSAWSQKVSLNFNNEKVEKVLSSIKAQTGMGLVFSDQLIRCESQNFYSSERCQSG